MKTILHLSHTDINFDSRILKEMNVGLEMGGSVYGFGIRDRASVLRSGDRDRQLHIESAFLLSRKLGLLPDIIRHSLSLLEFYIKAAFFAKRIQPDLIHCNDNLMLPLGVMIKCLNRKRKLVYDVHELESNKNGQSRIQGRYVLITEKLLWRYVDALIVVSPSIQNWYENNVGTKRSVVVLNSPIVNKKEDVDGDYLRSRFAIPINSKVFIYIGNVVPGRGLELIVDAFNRFDNRVALVILGRGELIEVIRKRNSSAQNIYFHDPVPHEQVVGIARFADFGFCLIENVSLSDYFCLPNKLFEYLFAGVPVIASDFPDIAALIKGNNFGLCVEGNVDSISSGIRKILDEDLNFSVDLSKLTNYGWPMQAATLSMLYSELLFNLDLR